MDLLKTAVLLFIVLDPLGVIPVVYSMLGRYSPQRRNQIIIRESLFALGIMLVFLIAGTSLMQLLGLEQSTLNLTGGILLFMVAIGMVFPNRAAEGEENKMEEPFIVPIAVPLIAGPAALAIIILHSSVADGIFTKFMLGIAIFLAWLATTSVVYLAQYFTRFLGKRGMVALERLMGMVLAMISIQMFLNGLHGLKL